jgi:PAS domain S-box-containing protein
MYSLRKTAARFFIVMLSTAFVLIAVNLLVNSWIYTIILSLAVSAAGTYIINREVRLLLQKIKNESDAKIKSVRKELQDTKHKLNIALENGNIGMWEMSPETNTVLLDKRASRLFGFRGDYTGSYKSLEKMVDEEDLTLLQTSIQKSLKSNSPLETIVRTRPRAGKPRCVSLKGQPVDNKNTPTVLAGVAFDITDLQDGTGKLLIKLNEELLRSNNELQKFAYIASHDLQEPLRMVTSFTQLLSKQYGNQLDSTAREYISFATDGAKRMYELLNGLLDYSRVNSRGKSFQHVNLSNVIESTMENLSLVIKERNAIIKTGEMPVVLADRNQMIQLFQNLLANGLKFSKGQPRITISSCTRNKKHIFSVKDEGIGIDPKDYDRIFEIFKRLHSRDEYEGTGVGLAICKKIIERHGGNIWVESTPGMGSTFFFTIPK